MATRPGSAARDRAPNLVVILADDLGYGDLGCYGGEAIPTPRLDALAAEGVRFTDFHASGAVCSPTRAGLVTGRYQQRCGIPMVISAARHRHLGLDPREITFAELLQAKGYATALFGKWHLGYLPKFSPVRHGFDEFRGYVSGNVDYISHVDQAGWADWWHGARLEPEDGYTTHLITKHSVDFIERQRERPFCLYIAHEAPHHPYQGPGDKADRTPGGRFPIQGSRQDRKAAYAEMVGVMDEGIGQVVAALRRLGLERDTFVFFFSDNGATSLGSNGPFRGRKATLWEGGHRVPAIAWWPGTLRAGKTCEELTISLDVFPTLVALGGASVPAGHALDGTDLMPILTAGKRVGDRRLFWAHGSQRAAREGHWKLMARPRPALYNLADDPGETKDLADQHPDRVRSLLAALETWEREVSRKP